jgi:hypothetical protein
MCNRPTAVSSSNIEGIIKIVRLSYLFFFFFPVATFSSLSLPPKSNRRDFHGTNKETDRSIFGS